MAERKHLETTSFCRVAAAAKERKLCEQKATGRTQRGGTGTPEARAEHASLSHCIGPSRSPAGMLASGFCETPPFRPNTPFSFGCDQRQTSLLVQPSLSETYGAQAGRGENRRQLKLWGRRLAGRRGLLSPPGLEPEGEDNRVGASPRDTRSLQVSSITSQYSILWTGPRYPHSSWVKVTATSS